MSSMVELIRQTEPWAPVNLTVGGTSVMILSPILDKARLVAIPWVASAAYAQGAIVAVPDPGTTGKPIRYYWVPVAGTAGTNKASHTTGDWADNNGLVWRAIYLSRSVITLTNMGDSNVFIARGQPAVVNKGILLSPSGGGMNEGYGSVLAYDGAWYAISDGSSVVAISEG